MSNEHPQEPMIRLLDASEQLPGAATLRSRTYDLLALPPGGRVVDVGCGTGRAAAELAVRGATVTGVDNSAHIRDVARERWPWLDLREADALALPLKERSQHGYRADKVLHALDDPDSAVHEAFRVLTPGGRIVLIGQDWETLVIDADDADLTGRIVLARASTMASPLIARRYRNLLLDTGFTEVAVEVHTAVFTGPTMLPLLTGIASAAQEFGAITAEETASWQAEQTRRAHTDRLFLAVPFFLASATRP